MASGVIKNLLADGVTWNALTAKCSYAKKNGTVYVNCDGVANLTGGSWNTIGTLPQGYRPTKMIYFLCGDGGSNSTLVQIDTTGLVSAKPYASGTHSAYGIMSFPI